MESSGKFEIVLCSTIQNKFGVCYTTHKYCDLPRKHEKEVHIDAASTNGSELLIEVNRLTYLIKISSKN